MTEALRIKQEEFLNKSAASEEEKKEVSIKEQAIQNLQNDPVWKYLDSLGLDNLPEIIR